MQRDHDFYYNNTTISISHNDKYQLNGVKEFMYVRIY